MERRSTAVPDIRNAVARDWHNGLCAFPCTVQRARSDFGIMRT